MRHEIAGERIQQLRSHRGWDLQQMATACGLSVHAVQQAEAGEVSEGILAAIAGALGEPRSRLSGITPADAPQARVLLYARAASVEWLCSAFGLQLQERLVGPDGRLVHAELVIGGARIAVGLPVIGAERLCVEALGPGDQIVWVQIDDVQAHHAIAQAAGAEIRQPPAIRNGRPCYQAEDPEGHRWWFVQPGG